MTEARKLYSEREEWKDIQPHPLPQKPGDAFQVTYTKEYLDLMGYFLAVLDKREVSDRAIAIASEVIDKFPAHYTAWWYKCFILEKKGYDFKNEVSIVSKLIDRSPKSYQAWQYRQFLFDRVSEDKFAEIDEVPFMKNVFANDAKNFHAWSFAIWYADRFKKYKDIYDLAVYQIQQDMRNNSAWNARKAMVDFMKSDIEAEFDAAAESLNEITKNEAAVNYAIAMVEEKPELIEKFKALGQKLYERNPKNAQALHILLWVATDEDNKEMIKKLCNELIVADPIRKPYYSLIIEGKISYK